MISIKAFIKIVNFMYPRAGFRFYDKMHRLTCYINAIRFIFIHLSFYRTLYMCIEI